MGRSILAITVAVVLVAPLAHAAILEVPGNGMTLSGIGFISGWKCDAQNITVTINEGGHIPLATEQPRIDTRIVCGDVHNGFITQVNWNRLGDSEHTIIAYNDSVEFARATFTVVTTGEEFLWGAKAQCYVPDFPAPGENARLEWIESTQHFELADVGEHVLLPDEDMLDMETALDDVASGCVLAKNGEPAGGYLTEGRVDALTDIYCVEWRNLFVDPCVHSHDLSNLHRHKYTLLVQRIGNYDRLSLLSHGNTFDFRTPQGAYYHLRSIYRGSYRSGIKEASAILDVHEYQVFFRPDFHWATYDRRTGTIDWSNYPHYPASRPDGFLEQSLARLTNRIDAVIETENTMTYPVPLLCRN